MTTQSDGFREEFKAQLSKMADDWVSQRYYECLMDACTLFSRFKDDRACPENKVAVEFIRRSVSGLAKDADSDKLEKQNIACSFCTKAAPEVRLGAGAGVIICNECVATFQAIL
jgi:hypothetical protein